MILVYALFGASITYFGLRNTRSVWRHIATITSAIVAVALLSAWSFDLAYPYNSHGRNLALPYWTLGGAIAAIMGPAIGAILAMIGRKARIGAIVALLAFVLASSMTPSARAASLVDEWKAGHSEWIAPVSLSCNVSGGNAGSDHRDPRGDDRARDGRR